VVSPEECNRYIAGILDKYQGLAKWQKTTKRSATDAMFVETALGRRRYLPDIRSRDHAKRSTSERMAINTPVQGTAADLIKIAMVRVSRALKEAGLKARMVLQIHDELLFDVPRDEVETVKKIAVREMSGAMDVGVPLEVSVGVGSNWLEAH
jgi:DNA polymerase-1